MIAPHEVTGLRRCRAAAVAAVAVLALSLTCAAATARSSAAASPASSATPPIDAGLARVTSVRGTLVLDPPYRSTSRFGRMARTTFAATSAGDRRADVHYSVDWAAARRAFLAGLADLRKRRASYSTADYAEQLADLHTGLAVPTRILWVQDASARTATWVFFSSDPVTREPVRARYFDLPFSAGLPPTPDRTESWRVWELATELRAAMAEQPGITVTDALVRGLPGYRVAGAAQGGGAPWSALVDKATGLTVAVAATGKGEGGVLPSFHVTGLQVNKPLPPGTFAVRPDYRVLPHPPGKPKVVATDLATGVGREQWFPATDSQSVVQVPRLVPARVPPGFKLQLVRRYAQKGGPTSLSLIYRRGMSTLVTWSGPREGNITANDDGVVQSDRIAAFDRSTWPPLGGSLSEVDAIEKVPGGALSGAPATMAVGIGGKAELQAWTARDEAYVSGDLTRAELLSVAGSLEPYGQGAWHQPKTALLSWIAVVVAAVAAAATAWVWMGARRDVASPARPNLSILTWPLAGLTVVAAGACFEWHALFHNGPAWGMRGWAEPLGRWVIAAALAAVVCAAWVQLAAGARRRRAAKTGALFLSAAALAGAALALVYLPAVARFVVYPGDGSDPGGEAWLTRIVSSRFGPSATVGLYVSIVGAMLLFVGVLLLRRRLAAEVVGGVGADPTSPDAIATPAPSGAESVSTAASLGPAP
jgi:hypothetical protein